MITLLASFIFFVVIVAAMSIGVLMGRKPVSGSCGGLASIDGMAECEICGGNPSLCEEETTVSAQVGKPSVDGRSVSSGSDDKYYSA